MTRVAMKAFSPFGSRDNMRSSTSPCPISKKGTFVAFPHYCWAPFRPHRTLTPSCEGNTKRYHCTIDIDIVIGRTVVAARRASYNSAKLTKLPPTAFRRVTVCCVLYRDHPLVHPLLPSYSSNAANGQPPDAALPKLSRSKKRIRTNKI